MTMRERMARALAKADGKDPDAPAWVRYPGATTFGICWRDQYLDKVDAVLEVLREPSEGVLADAAKALQDSKEARNAFRWLYNSADTEWVQSGFFARFVHYAVQGVIDAVLAEKD